MTLSHTMHQALSHMAFLERQAAERNTCPHAILDGSGAVGSRTADALVRRGLAEHVRRCRFGATWPELRLTESGRAVTSEEKEKE